MTNTTANEQEEWEPLIKSLIRMVVQTFYEPYHIVITNILLEHIFMSEQEICLKMKMLSREFNRLVMKLKDDKIIKYDSKIDTNDPNYQYLKTFYYFDFFEIKDVIKYKIYKMSKLLENQNLISEDRFICKNCNILYSALDAQANMKNYLFICSVCKDELEEYREKSVKYNLDHEEFINKTTPMVDILKKLSRYSIPQVNLFKLSNLRVDNDKSDLIELNNQKNILNNFNDNDNGNNINENININDEEECSIEGKNDKIEEENTNKNIIEEGVMVNINGIPMKFQNITSEDENKMTDEEYEAYYELCEKMNK